MKNQAIYIIIAAVLCLSVNMQAQHNHENNHRNSNHDRHKSVLVAPSVGGIYYEFLDTTATIIQGPHGFKYVGDIVIPNSVKYGGKTYSVTRIGNSSFAYCNELKSITIPNSVQSIGNTAFYQCYDLTSINIPESVTNIGERAFEFCISLTSINVESENKNYSSEDGVLFNKDKTILMLCPREKTGKYIIPSSVTEIEESAFYECKGLTSIDIPKSVTSIGRAAFMRCSGITSIDIPKKIKSIGTNTFHGCSGLTSINIPFGITDIGDNAFGWCSGATFINIPNSVTRIKDNAFRGCKGITSITIPASVTSIGTTVFTSCNNLTSINVESGNQNYSSDNGVLFNKDKTTIICFPGGKKGDYIIPNNVTNIGKFAFYYCSAITSIVIPNSVKSIEEDAFSYCEGLTSIIIFSPNLVGHHLIDNNMNENCIIRVPTNAISRYKNDFTWKKYTIEDNGQTIYSLSVTHNDSQGGITIYKESDTSQIVTLTATANSGYKFLSWAIRKNLPRSGYNPYNFTEIKDIVVSKKNPYTFTLTEDVELIAKFQKKE